MRIAFGAGASVVDAAAKASIVTPYATRRVVPAGAHVRVLNKRRPPGGHVRPERDPAPREPTEVTGRPAPFRGMPDGRFRPLPVCPSRPGENVRAVRAGGRPCLSESGTAGTIHTVESI